MCFFNAIHFQGRKAGRHATGALNRSNSRYMQPNILTHQDMNYTEFDSSNLAHQYYSEIASEHNGGKALKLLVLLWFRERW